jgi:hypothetical protein
MAGFSGPNLLVAVVVVILLAVHARAADQVLHLDRVTVHATDLPEPDARALAATLAAARDVYTALGFDMPDKITLHVQCGPDHPTRLSTDGHSSVTLSIKSPKALARPAKTGAFHLYGLCHELGHVGMYRTLKERDWMTTPAAEGWAHYVGGVVVDRVHAKHGEALWTPDPYDYRTDGTARLARQLAAKSPDDVTRAAGLWQQLDALLGPEQMPKLFAAWQAAKVDPAKPHGALLAALLSGSDPAKKPALEAWWKSAAPLFVQPRPASDFKPATIDPKLLEPDPVTLKPDDDAPDGKKSIAGGAHARTFATPAPGQWYLRAVHVHAGRYGPAQAPNTQFDLTLCDKDNRPIITWKHPYKLVPRGQSQWLRIETPPTLVPDSFTVTLTFRPTAQSGVFVSLDTSTNGHSLSSPPGAKPAPLAAGDWMLRPDLSRPKAADALSGQQ